MGLFDECVVTERDVKLKMVKVRAQQGATVRTVSPKGHAYTVRHRPWAELLGAGPVGLTCGDCRHLVFHQMSRRFFKCGRQAMTSGAGTDIRKKDPCCRLFRPEEP